MGVAYGSTACMLSCAPMLMPLLVTNASSLKRSMHVVGIFSIGRIFAYTLIAMAASFASYSVKEILDKPMLTHAMTGGVMVFTALYLIYGQFFSKPRHICGVTHYAKNKETIGQGSYFLMGAMLSLSLCAPLLSLVAVGAASDSLWRASMYGLAFGLGAVLVSLVLYGFIFAAITKELLVQFHHQKKWIELTASTLLLFAGVMVIMGRLQL